MVDFLEDPANIMNLFYAAIMVFFAIVTYRNMDNNEAGKQAERLTKIETKLESICDKLDKLVSDLSRSNTEFSKLEIQMIETSERVKTLFNRVEKLEKEVEDKRK